ncbi:MAG: SPOR domain-containing protein [Candidatus Zixiibacteriota bacterium]
MKLRWLLVVLTVLMLLVVFMGCSEDSKEEAAKLEQEMMGQDSQTQTSDFSDSDTMAETNQSMDAGAVPEEEEEYVPTRPAGSGYTVQVASCESLEYAQHLIETYNNRGYEPYMTRYELDGQTYYRIRIGSFATKTEAENLKTELTDKFSTPAWVDYNE